ncbi:hypothetical protein XF_1429 [Xylella fastidiosa 9a5c]|uniref:Uncharacterized protein n=1 Tax=Xylella fastidiosa (strain 9a5c) TaxID=160492 RepID=Q9PDF0_XYLFA|nr:hypothetical protein XF_1429 [Xylella fastidiosa 9a5c]
MGRCEDGSLSTAGRHYNRSMSLEGLIPVIFALSIGVSHGCLSVCEHGADFRE